jgi:glycosyltransferase involved in cell wall biosynthesis
MDPLVTVAIPTYNRPNRLKRALDSVADQTYNNIEIVVVDDGSDEDYVEDIAASVNSPYPISVYHHEENKGMAAGRNTGIEHSDGEYIAFLDDDDRWEPTKIEKQVETLEREERSVCYVHLERSVNGTVTGGCFETHKGWVRSRLVKGGLAGPPAHCIKTSAARSIGGFDEQFDRWQEWDFFLRLADGFEFTCVPEVLLKVDAHGTPGSEHVQEKIEAYNQMINKHAPLPDRFGENATARFKASLQFGVGSVALKANEYNIARKYLFRSFLNDRSQRRSLLYALAASGGPLTHKSSLVVKQIINKSLTS